MSSSTNTPERTVEDLLIVFLDVTSFNRNSTHRTDEEIAGLLDELYALISERTMAAGGRVVKYIGDGALLVWDPAIADQAVRALLSLLDDAHELFRRTGWDSTLKIMAHAGPVVSGTFGTPESHQYDIIGKAVNIVATLETRTVSLSQAAFRTLGPETRQLLKKHTPPVVYIPAGDPRP